LLRTTVEHHPGLEPGTAQAALLQDAVDQVHNAGGGVVTVEPGCYVMTTLFLRSDVELHLQRGARLQAHTDLGEYPTTPSDAANKDQASVQLIAAFDCHDIAITGDGVIDGQDEHFWEPCTREEDRPYGIFRYVVRGGPRSRPSPLLHVVRCRNVRLSGFTVTAAPGWAVHLFDCDGASVIGLTVRGNPYGPNTDGIGINGSRDVRVAHCDVDTGDDAIIIKSTNVGMHCRNVTVTNCVLASNCAALGLGADVYGTISDVVFTNCVVKKSLRMIQVEMWFPGKVERAVFSGISGRTFPDDEVENERPIYIDIQQHLSPEPELGEVCDMVFRDILCESRGRIMMTAQDGSKIDGVTLDTVIVTVPEIEDPQKTVPRATSMQLSNFNTKTRAVRAAVVADNVTRLTLRDVEYRWPDAASIPMYGLCCRNVTDLIDASPRLRSSTKDLERVLTLDDGS
jgi:polygalacturonase